ncbi:hypothetical protein G7Y89_g886 [Cudoniella acicularis]|uniref:CPAF-like PDZ domain-containing protein n=1 Tax=Cudoniella acicularis TaxID=354080 RepID=A0A8H4W8G4_9HELO|nr:hypothetical protein G7Y89_g886 [Cudoniella acicularis]
MSGKREAFHRITRLVALHFCRLINIDRPSVAIHSMCTIVNSPDTQTFRASLAYECLTSVPFNADVASRFLKYLNDTLQFQSTLTYLKNPPSSYQQPGVDLIEGLATLQKGIDDNIFPNEYDFEASLQTLLYATHDGHVTLQAGVLQVFTFQSPYDIVSLSLDGIQLPNLYLVQDLVDSNFFAYYQASPIASINGQSAESYVSDFAAQNSAGMIEPHADWNTMMRSAAQDIQGTLNTFSSGTFYPGDTITFVLENGTEISDYFQAVYNSRGNTGPLVTGGDFYNYFVLGILPASYDDNLIDNNNVNISDPTTESAAQSTAQATAQATETAQSTQATQTAQAVAAPIANIIMSFLSGSSEPSVSKRAGPRLSRRDDTDETPTCESWSNSAYPECADVSQVDLGTFGTGFVSGYFLNDTSTAVLSIPSFDESTDAIDDFDSTILAFITKSQSINMKKIVIDLQSNQGGEALLAIDTFKRFFPNIDPFGGSRMRAHPAANTMGQVVTSFFENNNDSDDTLVTNEWVSTVRLNAATNDTFASWPEFFGPNTFDGDEFTNIQRYDLANTEFDTEAVGNPDTEFTVFGYGSNPAPSNAAPAYPAEDIIILTDGICDSSCTLFVEMMHHEAGVKVVVAGGLPKIGPMQGASGTRGARLYDTYTLDSNIHFVKDLLRDEGSPDVDFVPSRREELSVYVTSASINLRSQVRAGQTIPLQFAYEAADCRIFYTAQTFYNYPVLWQYAADAIWTNSSLCVTNSTGYATTGGDTDFGGPEPSSVIEPINPQDTISHLTTGDISNLTFLTQYSEDIEDAGGSSIGKSKNKFRLCGSTADCRDLVHNVCANVTICQPNGLTGASPVCIPSCRLGQAQGAPARLCGAQRHENEWLGECQ